METISAILNWARGKQAAPFAISAMMALFTGFSATDNYWGAYAVVYVLYMYVRYITDNAQNGFARFCFRFNVLRESLLFLGCGIVYLVVIMALLTENLAPVAFIAGLVAIFALGFHWSKRALRLKDSTREKKHE